MGAWEMYHINENDEIEECRDIVECHHKEHYPDYHSAYRFTEKYKHERELQRIESEKIIELNTEISRKMVAEQEQRKIALKKANELLIENRKRKKKESINNLLKYTLKKQEERKNAKNN